MSEKKKNQWSYKFTYIGYTLKWDFRVIQFFNVKLQSKYLNEDIWKLILLQ